MSLAEEIKGNNPMRSALFHNLSIRTKLLLLSGVSAAVGVALACIALAINDSRTFRETKVAQLEGLARMLAFNSTGVLTFHDSIAGEQLLASLQSQPTVEVAYLVDMDQEIVATYKASRKIKSPKLVSFEEGSRLIEGGRIEIVTPIIDEIDGKEIVGTLHLWTNTHDLRAHFLGNLKLVLVVVAASLLCSMLLSFWLQSAISTPVLELAHAAERISSAEDFSIRVKQSSNDELGTLYAAFNQMLDQVENSEGRLKSAKVELLAAKEKAEAGSRMKSEFLANMSHEIRTPLTGILGFTDVLLAGGDDGDPVRRADYLQTIRTSGQHLLCLINDILDLSKIESGQMEMENVPISPSHIIAEVVSVLRTKAAEKGVALEARWTTRVPETIRSDSARLRQLLINLVGNAVKFTMEGSVTINAALERTNNIPRLRIDVIDTGVGIAREKLDAIFDPFVQADASVTRKFGGTGLGLAICYRIALTMGGTLSVQSRPNRGSKFTFVLPTGSLECVTLFEPSEAEALQTTRNEMPSHDAKLPPGRVLLVEDGDTNRKLIRLVLKRAGLDVVTAENGKLGVEQAREEPFDLILMDMQMPVMDGYTATSTLRHEGFQMPIIALTAHAMKGDEAKCLAAGCSGYLAKPIDTNELLRTLGEVLAKREALPDADTPEQIAPPEQSTSFASSLPIEDPEFRGIVEEFLETLHQRMDEMVQALEENDIETVGRLAHWLKGAGGTAGFDVFTKPANQLQNLSRETADPTSIKQLVDELSDIVSKTMVSIPE